MKFLVQKPFIRPEAEAKKKLRKIRIQLEMLLVPVEQRSNFLGIAFHICKHFQKCKCYINRYKLYFLSHFCKPQLQNLIGKHDNHIYKSQTLSLEG